MGVAHRAPLRTRRYSARFFNVVTGGVEPVAAFVLAMRHPSLRLPPHADRRLRPFARRRATTLRPPVVAMRLRKPCRRLRTSLLGW